MSYYAPLRYAVTADEDGWSVRAILKQKLQLSRRLIIRVKQTEDGILVNGKSVRVDYKVQAGDVLEVRMKEEESETIAPQYFPLDILHEDDDLLALNKPPGKIVHPTFGHDEHTIANAVMHYWQSQGKKHRFRAVHRLDQDTSGVLLIAKTPYAHQQIALQLTQNEVEKRYIAYVHGVPSPHSGTICAPIGRDPDNPHIRKVLEGGAHAVTHYRVEEQYGRKYSKVELQIETGRTHQIRVHMQHAGCPLIADEWYAEGKPVPGSIDRQALHASSLRLIHPTTKQPLQLTAPLPEDLVQLEQYLRENSSE